MIYAIADTHFEEWPIIDKFYSEDFNGNSKMYQTYMINRWKSKIGKEDTVILCGDAGKPEVFEDLPGHIHLIRGNHDDYREELYDVFASVRDYYLLDKALFTHKPAPDTFDANILIYGHLHFIDTYKFIRNDKTHICLLPNLLGYEPRPLLEILSPYVYTWQWDFYQLMNSLGKDIK